MYILNIKTLLFSCLILLFGLVSAVHADCVYDGKHIQREVK